jgi:hypothetical protein
VRHVCEVEVHCTPIEGLLSRSAAFWQAVTYVLSLRPLPTVSSSQHTLRLPSPSFLALAPLAATMSKSPTGQLQCKSSHDTGVEGLLTSGCSRRYGLQQCLARVSSPSVWVTVFPCRTPGQTYSWHSMQTMLRNTCVLVHRHLATHQRQGCHSLVWQFSPSLKVGPVIHPSTQAAMLSIPLTLTTAVNRSSGHIPVFKWSGCSW